jgi:IQ calmodulin-binding motif
MGLSADWSAMPPPPPPPGPPPRKPPQLSLLNLGVPPPPPPPPPPGRPKQLSSNLSMNTASTSTDPSVKSGVSIVEERRRAAMAMYDATDFMDEQYDINFDSPKSTSPAENDRYSSPIEVVSTPLVPIAITNLPRRSNTPPDKREKKSLVVHVPDPSDMPAVAISTPKTPTRKTQTPKTPTPKTPTPKTPTATRTPSSKSPGNGNADNGNTSKNKTDSATPDKKKRGFFKKILSGRKKDKTPSPAKSTPKRGKKTTPTLGRPLDAKPGSSYMSTPHSAEIVVRKESDTSSQVTMPTSNTKVETVPSPLAVKTHKYIITDEEAASLEINVSFSPPRFDNGRDEPVDSDDFDTTAAANAFRHDRNHPDDISAMTEPTDGFTAQKTRRPPPVQMQALYEEEPASDPFGHYWDGTKKLQTNFGIDPFEDPFFKEMEKQMPSSPDGNVIPDPPLTLLDYTVDDSDDDLDLPPPPPPPPRPAQPVARSEVRYAQRVPVAQSPPPGRLQVPLAPSPPRTRSGEQHAPVVHSQPTEDKPFSANVRRRPSVEDIMRKKREHRESHQDPSTVLPRQRRTVKSRSPSRDSSDIAQKRLSNGSDGYAESEGSTTTAKAIAIIRYNKGGRRSPARSQSFGSDTESDTSGTRAFAGGTPRTPSRSALDVYNNTQNSPSNPSIYMDSSNVLLSKFAKQGRKPPKPADLSPSPSTKYRATKIPSSGGSSLNVPRLTRVYKPGAKSQFVHPRKKAIVKYPPLVVDHSTVVAGVAVKAKKRQYHIGTGKSTRVFLAPRTPKPSSDQMNEADMDPIQRAGFRLLSKAAVPIQTGIRRYLGQKAAVDRMWAIIEVQSYFRRWRCEAFLIAHTAAATKIKATFRGWKSRDVIDEKQYCASEIQRIVRGYLAACKVYDDLYRVVVIQSGVRGMIDRRKAFEKLQCVIVIQACCRRFQSKLLVEKYHESATAIQSRFRSYSAQLHYQFDVVDIIIFQSLARRWMAHRTLRQMKVDKRNNAAAAIQAGWRGFQAYTDFIFSIADILVVQRTARQWLAIRQVRQMRKANAATLIQSQWRRYTDQMSVLYKLVHIIIAQSMIRRHLAFAKVRRLRVQMHNEGTASIRIQAVWRRFWQYSHYLILQYEIVRVQALYRGYRSRNSARLQLGCAIIIQATMRRFLAVKKVKELKFSNVLVASVSMGMRENIASRNLARGWRNIKLLRRQHIAGKTIGKFFIRVKEEVDREVRRQERRKASKKKRQKKEAEEKLLERVWLNTVDEEGNFGHSHDIRRTKSAPRGGIGRLEDPRWRRVNDYDNGYGHTVVHRDPNRDPNVPPPLAVSVRHADDVSELSAPSVFNRRAPGPAPSRYNTLSRKEMSDDLSLEEAWIDTEIRQVKERRRTEDEYLQRNGLQYHNSYHRNPDSRKYYPDGQGSRMKTGNQRHHQSPMRHEPSSCQTSQRRDQSPRIQTGESSRHQPYDSSPRKHASSRGANVAQKYYGPAENQRSHKGYHHESASPRRAIGSGGEAFRYPEPHTGQNHSTDNALLHQRSPARPRSRGRSLSQEIYSGDYASHGQDTRPGYYRA